MSKTTTDIVTEIVAISAAYALCSLAAYVLRPLLQPQQPGRDGRNVRRGGPVDRLKAILSRGGKRSNDSEDNDSTTRPSLSQLSLDSYEATIAGDVVDPSRIETRFADVGGMDDVKAELYDLVVLPLLRPDLFRSASGLATPPRGVLLYGAPGTGKTMLARAVAAEGRAAFVNVRLSSIMDKWFGESNRLVAAVFSLAAKLAPSVVFVDELDTFLRQRGGGEDNNASATMKSEFLTLWDGLTTDPDTTVTVLGATNRPYDVDTAILRRLPRAFEIGLPDARGREQILRTVLRQQDLDEDCRRTFLPRLASDDLTKGYSGSDLKELCRAAAVEPVRELTRGAVRRAVSGAGDVELRVRTDAIDPRVRPLRESDFLAALRKVKRTGESARDFQFKEQGRSRPHPPQQRQQQEEAMVRALCALGQLVQTTDGVAPVESSTTTDDDEDDRVPNLP